MVRDRLLGRRGLALGLTALLAAATVATGPAAGAAQAAPRVAAEVAAQVPVPAPVMGWASWNTFAAKIDYQVIKAQADALVSSGLAAAGYEYVNIDEGWWQGTRDADGNIVVDEAEWPGGMKAIADYIHSLGLKAGIYTDAGKDGCGYYFPTGRPAAPGSGSEGHYEQDMLAFSRWGFDFVKVDWCGGDVEGLDPKTTYQQISDAARAASEVTGRPLLVSICSWGKGNPWNWGAGTAPMWRTSTDIIFFGQSATLGQVLTNFDQALHPTGQHTGFVNDPDMLTVGMPGLSDDQARTEMNLWAVSGAPLLAGNNLTTMSASTKAILTNRAVIAVDQDPRGLQGSEVAEDVAGRQVYSKVLSGNGRRAVVLLNRTSSAATLTARWSDLGLAAGTAVVQDLWTGTTSTATDRYQATVPANSSVLVTVTGDDLPAAGYDVTPAGAGSRVTGVSAAANGLAVLDVAYANGSGTATNVSLGVNGQVGTVLALPPTGSASTVGTVSAVVSLRAGTANTLTFGAADVRGVTLRPLPGSYGDQVTGAASGRCVDIDNNSITNGIQAQLWDCTGGVNQTWRSTDRGELVVYGNKCLDAYGAGTANGTRVVIWDCNGGANQQWRITAAGTVVGVQSGLCLDANSAGTANGAKLILWTCSGAANQRWTVDVPPAA